jgi:phosphoglycolate phosphatase-like HAD superfamily hydrolase
VARAVLFDLDGTLWDSWPWYAQILEAHDAGTIVDQLALIKGGEPAARLLRDAGITAREIRIACATKPPPLYEGVAKSLFELRAAGVRLGAVTNLPKWLYEPMLEAHRETISLQTVVGWGQARRKPYPDPLELAIERLEERPGPDHWYVGDTDSDAKATVAAGMSFAWAKWGYGPECPDGTHAALESPLQIGELV